MKICAGTVVALTYDLCTDGGEIVESSELGGVLSFLHGSGAILPGLDSRLEGLESGSEHSFEFSPKQAFGTVENAPLKEIRRSEFPADAELEPGITFEAGIGVGQNIRLEVIEAGDDLVKVRMIHPLAGMSLSMSVKIVSVRAASRKETAAGMVLTAPPPLPAKR